MKMTVWLVAHGEYAEGHSPESIHATHQGAVAWACAQFHHEPEDFQDVDHLGTYKQAFRATQGCDETWVIEMEVKP